MTENLNSSDMNNPSPKKEIARRRRIIWIASLANLTVIIPLIALWVERAFPPQAISILIIIPLIVINGVAWLGWRYARPRVNRSPKPRLFLLVGALAAIGAIVEIASKDYSSAGIMLTGCVGSFMVAVSLMRRNAKRDTSGQNVDAQ